MNTMFEPRYSFENIRYANEDEIENIADTCILYECDSQLKLPRLFRHLEQMICDSRYFFLNIAKFENVRWMLQTKNGTGGGLFALVTLGAIRQITKNPILVGEWKGQSFNITHLYEAEFPQDIQDYYFQQTYV